MRNGILVLLVVMLCTASPLSSARESGKSAEGFSPAQAGDPIAELWKKMTGSLDENLQVKNILGDPVKIGDLTIIPIVMVDFGYATGQGGAMIPGIKPGEGFYLKGEVRPLGFIVIGPKGTQFLSAGDAPRK